MSQDQCCAIKYDSRFDAAGKLDADASLLLPRVELKPDLKLDASFADEMVRCYFAHVTRDNLIPMQVQTETGKIRVRSLLGKTAFLFEDGEQLIEAERVETSWRIAGGFMLAHRVTYGGRFFIGAHFEAGGSSLVLYTLIRRYTPRLVTYFGVARGTAIYQRTQGANYRVVQEKFLCDLAAQIKRAQNAL